MQWNWKEIRVYAGRFILACFDILILQGKQNGKSMDMGYGICFRQRGFYD